MKAIELRNKNLNQLQQNIAELLEEQFKLRVQRSSSQLIKYARMKTIRKDVARIKTIINENAKRNAIS